MLGRVNKQASVRGYGSAWSEEMTQKEKWLLWCAHTKQDEGHLLPANQEFLTCGTRPQKLKGQKPQWCVQRRERRQDNTLTPNISHILLSVVGMTDKPHWKLFIGAVPCHHSEFCCSEEKKWKKVRTVSPIFTVIPWRPPLNSKAQTMEGCSLPHDKYILSALG